MTLDSNSKELSLSYVRMALGLQHMAPMMISLSVSVSTHCPVSLHEGQLK